MEDHDQKCHGHDPQTNESSYQDGGRLSCLRTLSKRNIVLVVCILIMYILVGCSFSLLAPFFPIEAEKKGLSTTMTGLVFTIFEVSILLISPIYATYATRWGIEFVLKAGIVAGGWSSILFGVLDKSPPGRPFLLCCLAVRVVGAIGYAAVLISGFTILNIHFPKYLGTIVGFQDSLMYIGMMVGPVIGGVFYRVGGFGLPFYVCGIIVLVNWLVLSVVLPSSPPRPLERNVQQFRVLRQPLVIIATLNIICKGFSQTCILPVLAVHLKQLDLTPEVIGVIFMITPLALVGALPFMSYLVDKKGFHCSLLLFNTALSALAMALVGPSPWLPFFHLELWLVILSMILLGISQSAVALSKCLVVGAQEAGLDLTADTYAMTGSLFEANFSLGAILGTFFGGMLTDVVGFPYATTIFSGYNLFTLLITVIYLVVRYGVSMGETYEETTKLLAEIETSTSTSSNALAYGEIGNIQAS